MHDQMATPESLFADFIAREAGVPRDDLLPRTASWLCVRHEAGDVCLDLAELAGSPWPDNVGVAPPLDSWRAALLETPCVVEPGGEAPLVLDGSRLYLYRLWRDEVRVAEGIRARLTGSVALDEARLRSGLRRLFPDGHGVDWQKIAVALAVARRFAVISGGPGTGKTTSLARVLCLLLEQQPEMRIRLAAPTGKAAARMMESLRQATERFAALPDAMRARIPQRAMTLHRLLGYGPGGFRHDGDNPLPLDCLVVDEASMIDLPMMARLLEALPSSARLILLGDRDQLASVEAGSVLGDITGHGRGIAYRLAWAQRLAAWTESEATALPQDAAAPEISDAVALLRTSHRFRADSPIGRLARAVNEGDGEEVCALLAAADGEVLRWVEAAGRMLAVDAAVAWSQALLRHDCAADALELLTRFRVLCAVRYGPHGVVEVNRAVAARLTEDSAPGLPVGHGTPIMVTANDDELGLFNGDVGLLWADGDGDGLRAWFVRVDGAPHAVPLPLLPAHEPCWAMTVHKSQGSEFDRVALLLPDEPNPLLSRELLYTAITRTRTGLDLCAAEAVLRFAVSRQVRRGSGLAARLGWEVCVFS